MDAAQIERIIRETVQELSGGTSGSGGDWLCDTAEGAIASAKAAQAQLMALSLVKRGELIEAMRTAARKNVRMLSELANQETGYGRVDDKILKNTLAIDKTPGVEDLTQTAWSGDDGLTLVERAPFGVIGSITPSTNPTATVINNAISMIAAGNSVVFNPHPAAKRASQEAMRILNEAIAAAGGPRCLLTTVKEPTLDTGKVIMTHPDIRMLAVTGGEAVVEVAMVCGKKTIAAGPGNPPVIVDETADLRKAARDIVDGAGFDNNVLCIAEKEVFVLRQAADRLMDEMAAYGAQRLTGQEIDRVERLIVERRDGRCFANRKYVGRDAAVILRDAGVAALGDPRIAFCEVDERHPFVTVELLMPILPIVRVDTVEEAIAKAVIAENGCKHTAVMHSHDITRLSLAAKTLDTTIFVKNAPSYAGLGFTGEGFTTLTIATPTGEGLTSARSFTRLRRCVLQGSFRII